MAKKKSRQKAEDAETRTLRDAAALFRKDLEEDMERTKRVLENFPFPPGKKYKKQAEAHRRNIAKAIELGQKAVKRLKKVEARKKKASKKKKI